MDGTAFFMFLMKSENFIILLISFRFSKISRLQTIYFVNFSTNKK